MMQDSARAKGRIEKGKRRASPWARGANWAVGTAAAVLLALSVGGYLFHRGQLAEIVAEHLRVMVMGPPRLQAGMPNRYTVATSAVTGIGMPAQVELAVYNPAGKQLMRHKEKTDENGQLAIDIPGDLAAPPGSRLEVLAVHQSQLQRLDARLAVEPVRYATALALDRPLYGPGETVLYRSLSLSRFGLAADREFAVNFEILDPRGATVPGTDTKIVTQKGAAGGQFTLPGDAGDGTYTLVARSGEGAFPVVRRTFVVRAPQQRRIPMQLELVRDAYAPGETVVASFSADRPDGGALAGAKVNVVATVDGQIVYRAAEETSEDGVCRVQFALPKQIARGDAQLAVSAGHAGQEGTIAKRIPIALGRIDVRFHPEGGCLAADLENRVYFTARDPLGKRVSISGRVLDSDDNVVSAVETGYGGMGSFNITPRPGRTYRLRIDSPAGVTDEPKLPAASSGAEVVIAMGLGVFGPDKPLEFTIRASEEGLPLVAAAWCRGKLVGQTALVTRLGPNGSHANSVAVPLAEGVGGVMRLVVYDYSGSPPRAVAQRVVYRSPEKRLQVKVGARAEFSPGDAVDLSVLTCDETGEPVAAALGVGVVDEALLQRADDPGASVPVQFLLTGELENGENLANADFYLSGDPRAPVALDLLLGNQSGAENQTPPMLLDNLGELRTRYEGSLATYRAQRTRTLNTLTTVGFFGGASLVLLVAMLALLNIPTGVRLWIPALATAAVCLVIGAILMNPGRLKSGPDVAVAFTPFDAAASAAEQRGLQEPATRDATQKTLAAGTEARPAHAAAEGPESRSATTPYWNPLVAAGADGRASVRFDLPEAVATFRVWADAHSSAGRQYGRIGAGSGQIIARLPFRLGCAPPPEVTVGDRMDLPLVVENVSRKPVSVEVMAEPGALVGLEGYARRTLQLRAEQTAREYFTLDVAGQEGVCPIHFRATDGAMGDSLSRRLLVVPQGFPQCLSYSGLINGRKEEIVELPDTWAAGSLEVRLEAFPSLLANLEAGAEGLLRAPQGTFEQTASMVYANALILQAAQEHGVAQPAAIRRAKDAIAQGRAALISFVAAEGGFASLPGGGPNEPLTAFGLVVLSELKRVDRADATMLERIGRWLLAQRVEGQPEPQAADEPVQPLAELDNAYILWALAEAGQAGIQRELERAIQAARQSDDPYLISLAALAALRSGKASDAKPLAEKLVKLQAADGSVRVTRRRAIEGYERSLAVETTALAAMAWLQLPEFTPQAQAAVGWILGNRDASGQFGSAQATVMALRALVERARRDAQPVGEGMLLVKRDDLVIAQRAFKAGRQGVIAIDGLESMLKPGKNRLVMTLSGGARMPYVLGVRYWSAKAPAPSGCPVTLSTKLAAGQVKAGGQVALVARLGNTTDAIQPMTVAVLGLPAGLEARVEQLDALKKAGTIDGYKLRPREVICYWRSVGPKRQIDVVLALSASLPGRYTAAPSYAYLADVPHRRGWAEPIVVEISRP